MPILETNNTKNPSLFILGIFFLVWSDNAYFILGNSLKYTSLLIGFLFLVLGGIRIHKSKEFYLFFGTSLALYLIYFLVGLWNHQNTLEPLNLAFSIICYILLLIGYLYGSLDILQFNIKSKYKILLSFLVIIGSLAFYYNQMTYLAFSSESMRDLGDESLNAVGIAYSHSLLIVFLFWLLQQARNRFVKFSVLIGILSAFIVVVSTLSRGAILFLSAFFLLYYIRGLNFNFRFLIDGLKTILGLIISLFVFFILAQENEFLQLKLKALDERFQSLQGYTSNEVRDLSAIAREDVYEYFFHNLHEFSLGQLNYIAYPHNQYLEIIMRWGVFGLPLLIFSLLIFMKGLTIFKKQRLQENPFLFLILSLFLFAYLQSMTSMSLEMNRVLWLGFGFLYSYKKKYV